MRNAFYAQSGGVTAVVNATACGIIQTARARRDRIGKVYAGRNGIIGALTEDLIDTSHESARAIAALMHTPSGAFGSCRYQLKNIDEDRAQYDRLIEVFRAHDIGYFFYNGGNDSADTCLKVSQLSARLGYPLLAVHVPKTVDNDLAVTDCCPGFGSVAKYVATSMREAAFDVASMAKTSTRIFVLEVMGRHAGWITAAVGLADDKDTPIPLVLLFPEIPFDEAKFLARCRREGQALRLLLHRRVGRPEEFRRRIDGRGGHKDAFGHAQLGGVGPMIAALIRDKPRPQVSLGGRRLPAACRAAPRVEDRRRARVRGRQVRGRTRIGRSQRGDARDRPYFRQALPLEDWRRAVGAGRQRREDASARLHHAGRIRDYDQGAQVSRTVDSRRRSAAVQERAAPVRTIEERRGGEKDRDLVQNLKRGRRPVSARKP